MQIKIKLIQDNESCFEKGNLVSPSFIEISEFD